MFKKYKKIILFLGILAILSPLGIILPKYFDAGGAWGEWSVEEVSKQTGKEPAGMKKDAELYNAPIKDYSIGKENDSLSKQSVYYILSGVAGAGIIILITFGISKFVSRKQNK